MSTLDDLELELRKLPGVRSAGFTERDDMLFVQVHAAPSGPGSGLALQATRLASRHTQQPVAVELVRWHHATPPAAPTPNGDSQEDTVEEPDTESPITDVAAPDLDDDDLPALVDVGDRDAEDVETVDRETAKVDTRVVDTEDVDAAVDLTSEAPAERDTRVKLLAVLSFPDTDEIEVHVILAGQRTIGRAVGSRGLIAAVDATIDALRAFLPGLVFSPAWAREVDAAEEVGRVVAVGLTDGRAPRHGIAAGDTDMEAAARATLDALNRTLALALSAATP